MNIRSVWIFVGEGSRFPSGVFYDFEDASGWILKHRLSGVLTKYPIGVGVYDWAIDNLFFSPKKTEHYSPSFVGKFTSASMDHFHFENGILD